MTKFVKVGEIYIDIERITGFQLETDDENEPEYLAIYIAGDASPFKIPDGEKEIQALIDALDILNE